MNLLLIGAADKTERFLNLAKPPFLIIDDGPIADTFLERFPKAKVFDVKHHTFNPLRNIDYKRAREIAAIVYTASPQGENTLTVRNGRRALTSLLLDASRLDKLKTDDKDPGIIEANATINDILLSPVLEHVLCNPTNFSFKGSVIVKLNRAELGDFDAFLLASLLIGQAKGQIIIPDFGFYGRDYHVSLIRQNRLIAGVQFLDELPVALRQQVLLIKDKEGKHCSYEDARTLANYEGLSPNTVGYNEFVEHRMEAQA